MYSALLIQKSTFVKGYLCCYYRSVRVFFVKGGLRMREEDIALEHKDELSGNLKKLGSRLSEYLFSNLYLFRDKHDHKVIFDKVLFIEGKTYDECTYIMPMVDLTLLDIDYLKEIAAHVDFIFPVEEHLIEYFENHGGKTYFTEGDTDYIYTVDKLSTFKGRKLHKKRNLLKQFKSMYRSEAKILSVSYKDDALNILDIWLSDVQEKKENTDYEACFEALNLMSELNLCGVIYYVDMEPAGFIMGEEITRDTFVVHFAKGKRKFKGIYQFIYNNFAKRLEEKYSYLNFEQDLGKMALKIAKSSYIPDELLKKYRISFK